MSGHRDQVAERLGYAVRSSDLSAPQSRNLERWHVALYDLGKVLRKAAAVEEEARDAAMR